MNEYGISMARVNQTIGEVLRVKLHRIISENPDGTYGLDIGKSVSHDEVAGLIAAGNVVRVLAIDDQGRYMPTDRVRIRSGNNPSQYIESYDAEGKPTAALFKIPFVALA